ncbi:MAG TPA: BON domain-containing protein [Polyangia bacterium]
MKRVTWMVGLSLFSSLGLSSGAAFADQVSGKGEMNLAKEIRSKLRADSDLKNNKIDVAVDNGVVTLSGTVDTADERARAAALAKIDGVVRVDDELEVGSHGLKTPLADAAITTKLKAEFLTDDTVRKGDISVTTNNGVVTLSGTVKSEEARKRAVELARGQDGVMRVDDKLTVTSPASPAPAR